MGPVLPFLSDSPAQLEAAVREIAAAGAAQRDADRAAPAAGHPGVVPALAGRALPGPGPRLPRPVRLGAYAPKAYQQQISAQVAELARKYRVGQASPAAARRIGPPPPAGSGAGAAGPAAAAQPEEVQLTLL